MGLALSSLSRRIKRFNLENRAHKEISKEKPTPAPAYPSTAKEIDRVAKDNPDIIDELSRKNTELYDRLKNVYLTSHIIKDERSFSVHERKSLPLNRSTPEETDFGFYEPSMIPKGRVTLRQALKFIADHQSNPSILPASSIAAQHSISQELTENILKYFKTFELYVPESKAEGQVDGGTVITQIEDGKGSDDKR